MKFVVTKVEEDGDNVDVCVKVSGLSVPQERALLDFYSSVNLIMADGRVDLMSDFFAVMKALDALRRMVRP